METVFSPLEVHNSFNGAPVLYVEQTESTMILAREIKPVHGTVIMAGFQSAGRGRIPGRRWMGEKNKNLLCTLILDVEKVPVRKIPLPLIIGLGLALYLEQAHSVKPLIKWPNDVLVSGKKISGIIIEQTRNYSLVGIGLNLNQVSFPEALRFKATSVLKETGMRCNPEEELFFVLNGIYSALNLENPAAAIKKRLFARGREIVFIPGDPVQGKRIKGILSGIAPDGTILIQLDNGRTVSSASGEIEYSTGLLQT